MDELSEEDQATAWSEITRALQPFEALMVIGVA
jgi:hypothetical protein